ncbi:hypothetical protein Kpol_1005p1 [Vanderwaltozyma polyspora DSM 70294]|uniref:PIH1 N-terminal domain-containing protein n=1 Tax=Vanderwaltozyma polyspora (strain ATCC 22028 / DSM 70294 / BCRC 21397 / CBS 2163 / NBRC 10782 / NRRL Y-8283 / UCD 57-17) TaxID=436907 RepID=A7TS28_VANPO|nr:uncharacterized protein Kpol_1005p1 [Vanderwaltozyma polyspora DSM 70294]EDO14914.1 hypothetical protein Kpol_1005p1 [Vanderwaltozyma polyspora DSM 70294]
MNNQWEIPIVTSTIREDVDKKGVKCYVCDCCINTKCTEWISKDYQLKEIVVEWCLESCELRESIEICRDKIAFPNLKKKGAVPRMEMLSHELTNDYENQITEALQETEVSDPAQILKMKRDLLQEDEEYTLTGGSGPSEELPPLFPSGSSTTNNKPLIEDISDWKPNDKNSNQIENQPKTKKDPKFEVSMRKTKSDQKFKLRIEISTFIESSLDLSIKYNNSSNELFIKNINLHDYNEQELKIPLPNIFNDKDIADMKCFYVKKDRSVYIFV